MNDELKDKSFSIHRSLFIVHRSARGILIVKTAPPSRAFAAVSVPP